MTMTAITRSLHQLGGVGFAGQIGWLSAGHVFRLMTGFAATVLVVQYLDPAAFGLLSYALALVTLFAPLVALGADKIVLKHMTLGKDDPGRIIGSAIALRVGAALVMAPAAVLVATVLRPDDPGLHLLVLSASIGLLFFSKDVLKLFFQHQQLAKTLAVVDVVGSLFNLIVIAFLVGGGLSVTAFAIAFSVQQLVYLLALMAGFMAAGYSLRIIRVRVATCRRILKEALPLILSSVAIILYMRIDQIMLGQLASDVEVGLYSSAVRLAEVFYFIPMLVSNMLLPRLMAAKEESREAYTEKFQQTFKLMALLGYGTAILMTLSAGFVVSTVFGESYAAAAPMLLVLVWTGLFVNLGVAGATYMTIEGLLKYHPATVMSALVLNVLLNLILIPAYGGMGAAVATLVSYWFAAHGACYLIPPLREVGSMITSAIVKPW